MDQTCINLKMFILYAVLAIAFHIVLSIMRTLIAERHKRIIEKKSIMPSATDHKYVKNPTLDQYNQIMFPGIAGKKLTKLRKEALANAIARCDNEHELVWRKATFFWALFAVVFASYGVALKSLESHTYDSITSSTFLVCIASLGIYTATAWVYVLKSARFWYKCYERHIQYLEDEHQGKLYKTFSHLYPFGWLDKIMGFNPISSSKVEQQLGILITGFWALVLVKSFSIFHFFIIQYSMENGIAQLLHVYFIDVSIVIAMIAILISRLRNTIKRSFSNSAYIDTERHDLPELRNNDIIMYARHLWGDSPQDAPEG